MANNYIPNGELAVLVGDGSISLPTPQPTKVSAEKVYACVETQSTTRADIFMKPKTDAQIAAIPNPTLGMVAVSSDSGKMVVRESAAWATLNAVTGMQYATINLTAAQINGMSAVPVQILPAPGAALTYIVHDFRLSITHNALFTGGGAINLQYGNAALAAGDDASNALAATFLTATAANKFACTTINDATVVSGAGSLNQALTITNSTAPFAAGGTSTGKVEVWYSVV